MNDQKNHAPAINVTFQTDAPKALAYSEQTVLAVNIAYAICRRCWIQRPMVKCAHPISYDGATNRRQP